MVWREKDMRQTEKFCSYQWLFLGRAGQTDRQTVTSLVSLCLTDTASTWLHIFVHFATKACLPCASLLNMLMCSSFLMPLVVAAHTIWQFSSCWLVYAPRALCWLPVLHVLSGYLHSWLQPPYNTHGPSLWVFCTFTFSPQLPFTFFPSRFLPHFTIWPHAGVYYYSAFATGMTYMLLCATLPILETDRTGTETCVGTGQVWLGGFLSFSRHTLSLGSCGGVACACCQQHSLSPSFRQTDRHFAR